MATFTVNRFFLAALLLIAVVPSSSASKYSDICFSKFQKCCYKYESCGFVTKKVYKKYDCSYKKCKTVCKPKCYFKFVKVPYKVCKIVPKKAKICKVLKYYHHGKPSFKKSCKSTVYKKKVCVTKYRLVKKKVCKKYCKKICKKIHATCVKIYYFSYAKFCPKLYCDKFIFKGKHEKPIDIIGKEKKLIKAIEGKRTIHK